MAVASGFLLCLATVIVPASPAAAAAQASVVSTSAIPAPTIVTTAQQLTDALTSAPSTGSTIRLGADIVAGAVFVPSGASVALELDGHSLTAVGGPDQAGVGVPAGAAFTVMGPGALTATGGARGAGIGGAGPDSAGSVAGRISILGGSIIATGGASSNGLGSGLRALTSGAGTGTGTGAGTGTGTVLANRPTGLPHGTRSRA